MNSLKQLLWNLLGDENLSYPPDYSSKRKAVQNPYYVIPAGNSVVFYRPNSVPAFLDWRKL